MKPYQQVLVAGCVAGALAGGGYACWCGVESLKVRRHNEQHYALIAEAAVLRKRMEISRGDELEAQGLALGRSKPWPQSRCEDPWTIAPEPLCIGSGLVVTLETNMSAAGAPWECSACGRMLTVKRGRLLPDHLASAAPWPEAEQVADGDDADLNT